jgi:hypothetical protein
VAKAPPPAETKAPPPPETKAPPLAAVAKAPPAEPAAKPKFTKEQVASRLRRLKSLYEDGLITDEFYDSRVAECEAAQ